MTDPLPSLPTKARCARSLNDALLCNEPLPCPRHDSELQAPASEYEVISSWMQKARAAERERDELRAVVDELRIRLQARQTNCDHAAAPCVRCDADEAILVRSLHA